MPRFVARPVGVEAHLFDGHIHAMPESFRLAVRGFRGPGVIDVLTLDGLRQCRHGDWIVHGPDGQFSVHRAATFETYFEAVQAIPEQPPAPMTAARAESRRKAHV
jgi:hypothetical protein